MMDSEKIEDVLGYSEDTGKGLLHQVEKRFHLEQISPKKWLAVFVAGNESVLSEVEDFLLTRGWSEADSEALIDNLEEWRLKQPLTEEEEKDIMSGMTERVYEKILARIDDSSTAEELLMGNEVR